MKSPLRRHLPLVLSLLVAAGCSQQPERPGAGAKTPEPAPTVQQPVADEVERLLALAARSRDPLAAGDARLEAVAELLRRGDGVRARTLLDELAQSMLSERQRARHALLGARLDLDAGDARRALARLQAVPSAVEGADAALQVELALARAEVHEALGRHLDGARERTAAHPWLTDDTARRDNARAIFAALAATDMHTLERTSADATSEDWRGWLELALVVRDTRRTPGEQVAELARWEQRYALIAALRSAADLLPAIRKRIRQPGRVALLLPLSGDAAAGGLAVLHGYLAEHLRQLDAGDAPPPVAIIDTSSMAGGFVTAYAGAVADGAEFVIGPLLKEDMAAFGPTLPVAVPTLALNFSDSPPPDGRLYSFGLDALDEADQLADAAHQRGLRQVVLLSDDSEPARRQAQRFRERRRALGDEDVADSLVLGDLNAFRGDFERTLLLEGSRRRSAALAGLLSRQLVTETRRRQDLQLLVMFANPVAARSLRPLVSFLQAGDLPLWAASQAHAARPSRRDDRDLEAVRFLDAPWFSAAEQPLREDLAVGVPAGGLQRLAALGVDACRLQSRSGLLEWMNALGLSGATGELVLDARRQLHRRLYWYAFGGGRVTAEHARGPLVAPAGHAASLSTEGETSWNTTPAMPPARQP